MALALWLVGPSRTPVRGRSGGALCTVRVHELQLQAARGAAAHNAADAAAAAAAAAVAAVAGPRDEAVEKGAREPKLRGDGAADDGPQLLRVAREDENGGGVGHLQRDEPLGQQGLARLVAAARRPRTRQAQQRCLWPWAEAGRRGGAAHMATCENWPARSPIKYSSPAATLVATSTRYLWS